MAPQFLLLLIALLIGILLALYGLLFLRLRVNHGALWRELNRPDLFRWRELRAGTPFRRFLSERRYADVPDSFLRVLCGVARMAPYLFPPLFLILLVLFALNMPGAE